MSRGAKRKKLSVGKLKRYTTHEAGAAAVACVRFEASVVVLSNVLRCGETARVAGEEENGWTCAGLVLEIERMASFEGRKDIILAAIIKICMPVSNWYSYTEARGER